MLSCSCIVSVDLIEPYLPGENIKQYYFVCRLDNSAFQLHSLIPKINNLRRTKQLYKERLDKKCSDLQKAEVEVCSSSGPLCFPHFVPLSFSFRFFFDFGREGGGLGLLLHCCNLQHNT